MIGRLAGGGLSPGRRPRTAKIPLIMPSQKASVPESWLENLHRGRPEKAAADKEVGGTCLT